MTGRFNYLGITLASLSALAMIAAAGLQLQARVRLAAAKSCRKALTSLADDLRILAAYDNASERLAAAGPAPESIQLPVSLPSPSSVERNTKPAQDGWETTSFSFRWKASPRSALDALSSLCALYPDWHFASFSLHSDGGDMTFEAVMETARLAFNAQEPKFGTTHP